LVKYDIAILAIGERRLVLDGRGARAGSWRESQAKGQSCGHEHLKSKKKSASSCAPRDQTLQKTISETGKTGRYKRKGGRENPAKGENREKGELPGWLVCAQYSNNKRIRKSRGSVQKQGERNPQTKVRFTQRKRKGIQGRSREGNP